MDAVWVVLGMLAVISAIQAADRVRSKRAVTLGNAALSPIQTGISAQLTQNQLDSTPVRDAESQTAVQSMTEPDRDLQQESVPLTTPFKPQFLDHHEPYDVLEEIAQLGQGEIQQIDRLARYVDHPDPDVRVAVAFALGELAASRQGKGVEEAIPLLSSLSADANLKVRLQAVIALGKIQSPVVLPLLQQAETHFDDDVSQAARNALQQLRNKN